MLSLILATFYLFLVCYSESLDCNGRQLEYHDFAIQPIIIWDTYTPNGRIGPKISDQLKKNVSQLIDSATQDFGFRCLLNYNGPECDAVKGGPRITQPLRDPSEAPPLLQQLAKNLRHPDGFREKFSFQLQSLLNNPPKVLKEYNFDANSITDMDALDALGQEVQRANRVGINGGNKQGHVVHWPILITDKDPFETPETKPRIHTKKLANNYDRVSVLTLKNAEAASKWKRIKEAKVTDPDFNIRGNFGVFNIPILKNIKQHLSDYLTMKGAFAEMNEILCSIFKPVSTGQGENKKGAIPEWLTEDVGKMLADNNFQKFLADDGVQQILIDPDVQMLISDPKVQKILGDTFAQKFISDQSVQRVFSDPEAQKLILDPTIQRMFSNPDSQSLIFDQNVQKILTDPAAQKLILDPSIQKMLAGGNAQKVLGAIHKIIKGFEDLLVAGEITLKSLDDVPALVNEGPQEEVGVKDKNNGL